MIIDGQTQKLRADGQSDFFCGVIIDLEANFVLNNNEINHTPRFDESVGVAFTHGQDFGVVELRDDFGKVVFPGRTNEKDLAVGYFGRRMELFELQGMAFDGFAVDDLLQIISKDVFTQYANHQGRRRAGEGLGRPIDKFSEMIDEGGFDLVLGGSILRTT